ncbi:MAG: hypothetical protein JW963_07790, partial [Anaerolineales bacterium]|nr:hypothetical protein [Anaerolineales bacterium]
VQIRYSTYCCLVTMTTWYHLVTLSESPVVNDNWWENTIALCLATLSDSTSAFQKVLAIDGVEEIRKLRLLATTLRYDPIIDPNTRQIVLSSILSLYHNGTQEESRQAFDMLVGIEDTWTAEKIMRSLQGRLPKKNKR